VLLITREWVRRLLYHLIWLLISGEMYYVPFAAHPNPWVPIGDFWSLLHHPRVCFQFLTVYVTPHYYLVVEGELYMYKPGFTKLEEGCKMIHAIQQIVSDLCLLPVPVTVTTSLPDTNRKSLHNITISLVLTTLVISPRNSTWITRPLSSWGVLGHKTKAT